MLAVVGASAAVSGAGAARHGARADGTGPKPDRNGSIHGPTVAADVPAIAGDEDPAAVDVPATVGGASDWAGADEENPGMTSKSKARPWPMCRHPQDPFWSPQQMNYPPPESTYRSRDGRSIATDRGLVQIGGC